MTGSPFRFRDSRPRARFQEWPSNAVGLRGLFALLLVAVLVLGCRAQNGSEQPTGGTGVPTAAFAQSATTGIPGLTVQFTDMSTGQIDSYLWNLGNGSTSTDPNPLATYPTAGSFTVSLTVTGPRGSSTMTLPAGVQVADVPTAGFDCLPAQGFVPFTIACTDMSTGGGTLAWDFGDGATSAGANPQHTYTSAGAFTVTQTSTTAGGSDMATLGVEAYPLDLAATPGSGSPPGDVFLTADTGSLAGDIVTWMVNGALVGGSQNVIHAFRTPGTYTVAFTIASSDPPLLGQKSFEYVVTWGPTVAAFSPSVSSGAGPLEVVFNDESTGDLVGWEWDFGDGTSCVYPAPAGVPANDPGVCDAASPTHTYDEIGRYDVQLTATGRGQNEGDPDQTDSFTLADAVTVTILDPSFEGQEVGGELANGWSPLRPSGATQTADHTTLSSASGGADAGMPSDGSRWASLDGLGTDGSTPVALVENGIRQDFLIAGAASVLEFDYVLLYSEPPAGTTLDAITATVSDGTTTVEIDSARADVASPFVGPSLRYPALDGSTTRVTPVRTASLDLATAFPGAGPDTLYSLTIRLANADNGFRSPRAYVDHVRFVEPASDFVTQFALATDPVVAGMPADFVDETCLDPATTGCVTPTSWRWDFDTQMLASVPDSTGSGEASPSYVFPEAGSYQVRLLARNADKESLATLVVSVLGAPVAGFDHSFVGSSVAPATLRVSDTSSSDPTDPIVAWSWDFGGWGFSSAQAPADVVIGQSGDWLVRLTVTTASGLEDTSEMMVTVD